MSAVTASLCSILMFVGVFVFVSADEKIITAKSGQDVTLPCRDPNNNKPIVVVNWSRTDLRDKYVFFYQDGTIKPDNQHPFFKNRVDLQDRQMKDGDVSLILKDVMTSDAGAYECHVFIEGTSSWKTISIIYLNVFPHQKTITAESGQNITLTCRAPKKKIADLHWSRADLGPEYNICYQDSECVTDEQHPSFKNRVDLQDRQMKDGDVSLILKDVTINDTGTYECRVFMAENHSWDLSIISLSVVDPPVRAKITVESGTNAILPCQAPNNSNDNVVEWTRADLEPEYVLLYRDGQFDSDDQHPSFKNRVDLWNRQMKDGDVSLILSYVTINDTGTYECRVLIRGTNRRMRAVLDDKPISIVTLKVDPPGGSVGLIAGLSVSALLLLAVAVGFFIYQKRLNHSR
ncbi:matrix remodeling-associated protein 8 [Oreochromis niloticus]|uniref:matrix remodeling-associated protein 8 n=1 Tax=Oreochromis niloticus TaxID=8128 RepID=UPI0009054EAF|nr:matrix remodeling-associated protein 8 [Oreochromis niloticus]